MEDEETRKERASGMFWKAEKQKGMLRKRTYETTVLTSKFIFKIFFLKRHYILELATWMNIKFLYLRF